MNWKKTLKVTGVVTGILASLATIGYIGKQLSKNEQPSLETRVTEKKDYPFRIEFGSPERKIPGKTPEEYEDGKETYGLGLAVLDAMEKEEDIKMPDYEKFYVLAIKFDTDRKHGISPKELSDLGTGKKSDGTERTYFKGLKPVPTDKTRFEYEYKVDVNPAVTETLNAIIKRHALARKVPYSTEFEQEMWRMYVMKWGAEKFGSEKSGSGYWNKDAVVKYDTHVKKVEEAK